MVGYTELARGPEENGPQLATFPRKRTWPVSEPARKVRVEVDAILYHNLESVEPDFDMKLRAGQLRCTFCGDDLNQVGIYSVRVQGEARIWCCPKFECIERSGDHTK
jgi:hypothetical protein